MKHEFEFGVVDLNMLRRQKYELLKIRERLPVMRQERDALDGVVCLLDAIDDFMDPPARF